MLDRPDRLLTADVDRAASVLRAGGLVGMPTETVYGLAADASNDAAVRRIYEVKGRPSDHPLIVHLAPSAAIDRWIADDLPHRAATEALATAMWPGPLTLVLPAAETAIGVVTGGRPTIGIRRPAHPTAIELLERFGGGLAAPSANRFGRVSPTSAAHVIDDIGTHLEPGRDLVLDGGDATVGVESTIVDVSGDDIQILRPGTITPDDVAALIEQPVATTRGPSRASGMLAAHYAPATEVLLADDASAAEATARQLRDADRQVDILDRTHDLVEAARSLYHDLRAADAAQLDALVVVLPPAIGLGFALRDRLVKAATGSARPSRAD